MKSMKIDSIVSLKPRAQICDFMFYLLCQQITRVAKYCTFALSHLLTTIVWRFTILIKSQICIRGTLTWPQYWKFVEFHCQNNFKLCCMAVPGSRYPNILFSVPKNIYFWFPNIFFFATRKLAMWHHLKLFRQWNSKLLATLTLHQRSL